MARDEREAEIEAAAYRVLAEKGFKGTSMLAVARAARASNETLYNWYGDKIGLFVALVARNTDRVTAALSALEDAPDLAGLERFGTALLGMVSGDRAVALNRAAAADASGDLGRALAAGGRQAVAPALSARIGALQRAGVLGRDDPDEVGETFIALLLGDMQIRRAIGVLEAPDAGAVAARAKRAVAQLARLYPAG